MLEPSSNPYAGMDPEAVQFNVMVEARTYKDVELLTTMVHPLPPGAKFGAREKSEAWITALFDQAYKTGKVPEHNIKLCVNWPSLIPKEGYKVKWPSGADGLAFRDGLIAKGLYPWSGNHTLQMMQKATTDHPSNILYRSFKTDITVVNLQDKDDIAMLLRMGFLQNKLDDFHKKTSLEDYLFKWHEILVTDKQFDRVAKTGADYRLSSDYVKHFANVSSLDIGDGLVKNKALITFVSGMAKTYGAEWDAIVESIQAQKAAYAHLKNADPRETGVNLWWYQNLTGISRQHRIALIDNELAINDGIINVTRLKASAQAQRSSDKTSEAILKLYNEKRLAVDENWEEAKTIVDVVAVVPGLGDPAFLKQWVLYAHQSLGAKDDFPPKFVSAVHNIMLTSSNSKMAYKIKKVKVAVQLVLIVFLQHYRILCNIFLIGGTDVTLL